MLYKAIPQKQVLQGFTLAEVLITLVIIGVIAAMTVPALMQSTNKKETLVALKKANSVLSQALYKIAYNNGYALGDYSELSKNQYTFFNEFAKVVNVTKTGDNWSGYKFLNNGSDYKYSDQGYKYLITADGMKYSALRIQNMTIYGLSDNDRINSVIVILVDVNGEKKPNKIGEDTFFFYIVNKKGIVPAGSYETSDCQPGNRGFTCAGKFLREGKVSYHPYQEIVY